MKLSVSSYSYSKIFGRDGFDIYKMLRTAKEQGFDAIEFSGIPNGESDPVEYAGFIKKAATDEGLELSNYSIGSDMINGHNGNLKEEVKYVKEHIDIAEALGVKCMRHDATYGVPVSTPPPKGFEDYVSRIADGFREVTEYAEKKGIATSVENHGYFCQDSQRVELLINKVGHKNFGALIDIGNFLCADEDPVHAVGILAPYVKHVHLKDFHVKSGMSINPGDGFFKSRGGNYLRGSIVGHGNVPVDQCVNIIKGTGYNGYLSLEFEGLEDPILAIGYGFNYMKRFL